MWRLFVYLLCYLMDLAFFNLNFDFVDLWYYSVVVDQILRQMQVWNMTQCFCQFL